MRRYSDVVFAAVRSFRLQGTEAADSVQMIWLRLVENYHRIQRPERLRRWLATTARQECLRILRHQAQHRPPTPRDTAEAEARKGNSSVDLEQDLIYAELVRRFDWKLSRLALVTDDSHSYSEVAPTAGIPPGGIGPTRARVLRQLQRRLDELELAVAVSAPQTRGSELPIALDALDPEVAVLSLPDVAERLDRPITRAYQMVRDGQLLGLRQAGVVVVPADFLSGRAVVKGLPDTITLL